MHGLCVMQGSTVLFFAEGGGGMLGFGFTPFAVHYEKMRNHLRETAINSAKIHSLARKYEHLRINQIQ